MSGFDLAVAIKQAQFLVYAQGKPSIIKGVGLATVSTFQNWQEQVMVPVTEVGLVGALDYHVASQSIYFSDRFKYIFQQHLSSNYFLLNHHPSNFHLDLLPKIQ